MPASALHPATDWAIPEHTVHAFRPRQARYAVCIFVLNEGERIRAQLRRLQPYADAFDLIVADGGSSDDGIQLPELQDRGVSALLVKTGAGRLSAQMRMALAFALQRGHEGIIVMDGNNKDDPEALPRFAQALEDGFDHVQGSRFLPGGRAINTPWSRWLAIRLVHAPLLSRAAGFQYTDTTNGFRAYSRRLLLDARVQPFRAVFSGYELHYYLSIRAARLGFRVTEVPVCRAYPADGTLPTKLHGLRGHWLVLRTLLAACWGVWDPPPNPVCPGG